MRSLRRLCEKVVRGRLQELLSELTKCDHLKFGGQLDLDEGSLKNGWIWEFGPTREGASDQIPRFYIFQIDQTPQKNIQSKVEIVQR